MLTLMAKDEISPNDVHIMFEWMAGTNHRQIARDLGMRPIEVVQAMRRVLEKLDDKVLFPEEVAS
jgi:hypothetical protein